MRIPWRYEKGGCSTMKESFAVREGGRKVGKKGRKNKMDNGIDGWTVGIVLGDQDQYGKYSHHILDG